MIFEKLLNLLFPLQNCEYTNFNSYLSIREISACKARFKKLNLGQSAYIEAIYVMSEYKNKIIFDLIRRSKYNNERRICSDFANSLHYKIFVNGDIFVPDPDLIIPVPADPDRIIKRGYNIPAEICKSLSKKINAPYEDVLIKTLTTDAQNKLQRKDRLNNLKGAFTLSSKPSLNFSNKEIIWILDDVSTTGTTLVECAKIIKKIYPYLKIYGIVISSN
jgi:ComF family protein